MKYCLTWFCGKKLGNGFYVFYTKDNPEGGISLFSKVHHDDRVFKPFIGSKEETSDILKDACEYIDWGEKTDWKITSTLKGHFYSLYNRIFNAWLDWKLFGPIDKYKRWKLKRRYEKR